MYDVVCIGGGVIGLLAGYELAGHGLSVAILDKGAIGGESSWAGAGILSPASNRPETDYERLRAFSYDSFPRLADQLANETGIDIGFRRTGGLELPPDDARSVQIDLLRGFCQEEGIECEAWTASKLRAQEPALAPEFESAVWLPGTHQVRNPRLLRALVSECLRRQVDLRASESVIGLDRHSDRVAAVRTERARIECGHAIVSAGAWSGNLLRHIGLEVPIFPVQGQMVAFQTAGKTVRHIVSVGKRYLVPRDDGLVLVGSTEDNVGFDKGVTSSGVAGLKEFAFRLFPELRFASVQAVWAGLRPGTSLESPVIGRAPGYDNLWIAAGHFRQGIQLSPGTARLLVDWITGAESFADPTSFSLSADRSRHRAVFHS